MRASSHCELMAMVLSVMFSMVRSCMGGTLAWDGSMSIDVYSQEIQSEVHQRTNWTASRQETTGRCHLDKTSYPNNRILRYHRNLTYRVTSPFLSDARPSLRQFRRSQRGYSEELVKLRKRLWHWQIRLTTMAVCAGI